MWTFLKYGTQSKATRCGSTPHLRWTSVALRPWSSKPAPAYVPPILLLMQPQTQSLISLNAALLVSIKSCTMMIQSDPWQQLQCALHAQSALVMIGVLTAIFMPFPSVQVHCKFLHAFNAFLPGLKMGHQYHPPKQLLGSDQFISSTNACEVLPCRS